MSYLFMYGTALPIIIGIVALATGAIRREHMFRKRKAAALAQQATVARQLTQGKPDDCLWVQQGQLYRKEGLVLAGTLMVVSNGSVAAKRLLDNLIAHNRAGLSDMVGSILVHECDSSTRLNFDRSLPDVYRDRIVFAYSTAYPDGFGNLPPDEVEVRIGRWSVPLLDAIEQVVKLHEERNGAKPGEILAFKSLGGHAFPGVFTTKELHQRLPDAQIFGVVNLPRKEWQREYFLALKARYEDAGVAGWLMSDQMERDWVTQDSVIADIFTGVTAAAIGSDSSLMTNNLVTNVTGMSGSGIARYEFRYSDVVAHRFQPDPEQPPKYYVPREQVINELRTLIGEIERGEGEVSLNVPVGEARLHTYDLALCALDPRDMLAVRDAVERSRETEDEQLKDTQRPHLHPQANYETVYASWSHPIDREHPRCRIGVIRLRAVRDVQHNLTEIVKVPAKRSFHDAATLQPEIIVTNGHSDDDFDKF